MGGNISPRRRIAAHGDGAAGKNNLDHFGPWVPVWVSGER
jgi:hypothetical protein